MKLYLMRHGQAAGEQQDPQQGLTSEGRQAIEQLARRLEQQGIRFSQIFHSDKTRAQQTATIMRRLLAPGIAPKMRGGLRPNDDPRLLIKEIEGWTVDTLITSHLPFIPTLLSLLTGELQNVVVTPGTIICLQQDNGGWVIEWVDAP